MSTHERFEALYRTHPDPFGYETSAYERRKYAVTLASLPRQRYPRAFEPGCSIGVLTSALAERCDELLATDVASAALERARHRLSGATGVAVEQRAVPGDWPDGTFDLIVFSELGYFLTADELDRFVDRAVRSLAPHGDLVAVDWLGPIDGFELSGLDVHARLAREPRLRRLVRHEEERFLLEVYRA